MSFKLTEAEFQSVVGGMNFSEQSREIAYGVLVEGRQQQDFVEKYRISAAAVSYIVKRVKEAYTPEGFTRINGLVSEIDGFAIKGKLRTVEEALQESRKENK